MSDWTDARVAHYQYQDRLREAANWRLAKQPHRMPDPANANGLSRRRGLAFETWPRVRLSGAFYALAQSALQFLGR